MTDLLPDNVFRLTTPQPPPRKPHSWEAVFPQAPGPRRVLATGRQRGGIVFRRAVQDNPLIVALGSLLVALATVGVLAALIASGGSFGGKGLLAPLVLALATVGVLYAKGTSIFWEEWAHTRGLELGEGEPQLTVVAPLIDPGPYGQWQRWATGSIGTDADAVVGHLAVQPTASPEQMATFTVVVMQVPVRIRGMQCTARPFRDAPWFLHGPEVEIENAALARRAAVTALPGDDHTAIDALLDAQTQHALGTSLLPVQWQQVGSQLVVFAEGHLGDSNELDHLCQSAALIQRRYVETAYISGQSAPAELRAA
jgi:hypothetical protein